MQSAKIILGMMLWLVGSSVLHAQDDAELSNLNRQIQSSYDSSDYGRTLRLVKKALPLLDKSSNDSLEIEILSTGSLASDYMGYYDDCQVYNFRLLDIFQDNNDTSGIAKTLNDIGIVNYYEQNYEEALKYGDRALSLYQQLDDSSGIAMCLINIANAQADHGEVDDALRNYHKALAINKHVEDMQGVAICLGNIGETYHSLDRRTEALIYYRRAISTCQEHNLSKWHIISPYLGRAKLYLSMGLPERGLEDAQKALDLANEQHFRAEKSTALSILSDAHEAKGEYDIALHYFRQHATLADSIYHDLNLEKLSELNARYEVAEKENQLRLQEIAYHKQEELTERNQLIIWVMIAAVVLIGIAVYFLFMENRKKKRFNELLGRQKRVIEEKNRDITESIVYARKIQNAIMPEKAEIEGEYGDAFVLYRPKDIVSGDFYWFEKMDDVSILAVVDCTGHGVPGAFMSIMASNLLTQVLLDDKIHHLDEAYHAMDERLKKNLRQQEGSVEGQDGFDISMILYNHEKGHLEYCGAKNDLYLIRDGEMKVLKANRFSIGGSVSEKVFQKERVAVQEGDQIYLFTDGIADQFGGSRNRKFSYRRLRETLMELHTLPMLEQKHRLDQIITEWKGHNEQIDDICMIGIKF